jgi:hypothetical protein
MQTGKMTFGKYKGFPLHAVDTAYLEWYVRENRPMLESIEAELERRYRATEGDDSLAERMIRAGYRALMMSAHPDQGGNDSSAAEEVEALKNARALLTDLLISASHH